MKNRNSIIRITAAIALAALAAVAVYFAKADPGFVTETYGPVSRAVSGALAKVFSVFSVSFAEFAIIWFVIAAVAAVIYTAFRRSLESWLRLISYGTLIAGSIFAAFIMFWGLNYYGLPLAQSLDITLLEADREKLYKTAVYYLEKANETAVLVERNADLTCDLGSFEQLAEGCSDGYEKLAAKYPRFKGCYAPPKKVSNSYWMSKTHITGVYCPITGECNVNPDSAPASLPFTMMHEIAHRLAVSPENEANFTAVLACRESSLPEFRYSGYYTAFVYLYNQVSRVDKTMQAELWYGMCDELEADVLAAIDHYDRNDGKVAKTADKVNDTYLKAMNQTSGVESYGEVVDLLIADYEKNLT